jgi:hypothetical protein
MFNSSAESGEKMSTAERRSVMSRDLPSPFAAAWRSMWSVRVG